MSHWNLIAHHFPRSFSQKRGEKRQKVRDIASSNLLRSLAFEALEARWLLAADFGDAPDLALGSGAGNYQTLATDNGASHVIEVTQNTLFLGNLVDGDTGLLQNAAANADDVNGTLPDDEDGVLSPLDLLGTVGAAPTVTLLATNTTGSAATLSGWIDYNQDGTFDNATERAQTVVPSGSLDGRFTLAFPAVPAGAAGTTYARFRLGTDSASQNPTGASINGEVEDHVFSITEPSSGTVRQHVKISDGLAGFAPTRGVDAGVWFGNSVANLGDLDGDGVNDLAVGAYFDGSVDTEGAVHILKMNSDGTVKSSLKIAKGVNGLHAPDLEPFEGFGTSVAALGDLDGDGVTELAVGAHADGRNEIGEGAVYILFLHASGTVKSTIRITDGEAGFLPSGLNTGDSFGSGLADLGDLDGDGVVDLAVGALNDEPLLEEGSGAAYVLFMNSNGTVKGHTKISDGLAGFHPTGLETADVFGSSLTAIGDLDGDGVTELAVGARNDEQGDTGEGAVYVLFMNSNGTVKGHTKISDGLAGFHPTGLETFDYFGSSLTAIGDLDGDGVPDLAVGAMSDENGDSSEGAIYVLLMNSTGTVKSHLKISDGLGGFTPSGLGANASFGSSIAALGDINGDGLLDLAVGALLDPPHASSDFFGSVYVLQLGSIWDYGDAPDHAPGTSEGNYATTNADGGPRHRIDSRLFLGDTVDGDSGLLQNLKATADNTDGVWPADEYGVLNPVDLIGTVGTEPFVTLLVTNTTNQVATLSGWIDYNQDGHFDNATERAQKTILGSVSDGRFILRFPAIPRGSAGTTYARFRLSTDPSASHPTGTAADGEVEDYVFEITEPSSPTVASHVKISDGLAGFAPTGLGNGDYFGKSVANLGDLDGDGVSDLAIGAHFDDNREEGNGNTDFRNEGAVYVLFMNHDGTVKGQTKISDGLAGFSPTALGAEDHFGWSVSNLGDLDGDGVVDLAVGAVDDENTEDNEGAVYILFLNSNGTVKRHTKISDGLAGFTPIRLEISDFFGGSLANLGDLDGDGVVDLAVGALGDENTESGEGAVYVLFLNKNGTVKGHTKISDGLAGFTPNGLETNDSFGRSLANLGDLDGDGVVDLAVGASNDENTESGEGTLYVLFLNSNGTVKGHTKISDGLSGFAPAALDLGDAFGESLANLGDLDGDGVIELAVGASNDENTERDEGAVYVLFLNSNGTVKGHTKISDGLSGFAPTALGRDEGFGSSLANLGDLNGDGVTDLAVGAMFDENEESREGALYVLLMNGVTPDYGDAPDASVGTGAGNYKTTVHDNGPSHVYFAGLFLGDSVDGDSGTLHNPTANADDVDGLFPDDEDGVLSPLDLIGTVGGQPTVALLASNNSALPATLSGWIDYNQDGQFDNATECGTNCRPRRCFR